MTTTLRLSALGLEGDERILRLGLLSLKVLDLNGESGLIGDGEGSVIVFFLFLIYIAIEQQYRWIFKNGFRNFVQMERCIHYTLRSDGLDIHQAVDSVIFDV